MVKSLLLYRIFKKNYFSPIQVNHDYNFITSDSHTLGKTDMEFNFKIS